MSRTIIDSNIAPGQAYKNRIINGDMRIDQRNAGGFSTIFNASLLYTLDMWAGLGSPTDGVFRIQRLSASPPTGFTNYLNVSIITADASVGSAQAYTLEHRIEGYNTADFLFGSASAKTVTLSFWVRSSVAGTYGVGLLNGAFNRCYTPTYTINSANVWEYKTITIPGDVTGTWATDNSLSFRLIWDIGSGSAYEGTLNTWAAQSYFRTSACSRLISTLSATLDITGVQLEIGVAATPFEYLPIQTQLSLCERYYEKSFNLTVVPDQNQGSLGSEAFSQVVGASTLQNGMCVKFRTRKRASGGTFTFYNTNAANAQIRNGSAGTDWSGTTLTTMSETRADFSASSPAGSAVGQASWFHWTAKSEL